MLLSLCCELLIKLLSIDVFDDCISVFFLLLGVYIEQEYSLPSISKNLGNLKNIKKESLDKTIFKKLKELYD